MSVDRGARHPAPCDRIDREAGETLLGQLVERRGEDHAMSGFAVRYIVDDVAQATQFYCRDLGFEVERGPARDSSHCVVMTSGSS